MNVATLITIIISVYCIRVKLMVAVLRLKEEEYEDTTKRI